MAVALTTGPRACSTQNKAKAALSQLELDFVSALLLVLCKLGQITLSLYPGLFFLLSWVFFNQS